MASQVRITVTDGPIKGREFIFDGHDVLLFGRATDCHACLPAEDATASRHHFILEANPPEARIRDLGSLNGTWINGAKHGGREPAETPEEGARRDYPQVDLHDGDQIQVGQSVLQVKIETQAVCCECGVEIPQADRGGCAWVGGTFICTPCREKALAANKPPEPLRCRKCGKAVAAEPGQAQRDDFVCPSCLEQAQDDPHALLMKLVEQAVRAAHAEAPQVADYEVEKKLGAGGFGAVYLARHRKSGRRVALKVMLARMAVDERARKLFQREIENCKELRHPHIVELLDHGSAGSAFYFTMEFCDGGSVADLIVARGGKLPLAEAGPLMLQALDGLAFVHDRGIVHRDLKPENVLLTRRDGGHLAKIADLGLAKNFTEAGFSGMTATGSYAGSWPYMPKEQLIRFKYVTAVSDVWAIGATFYVMLTGRLPREGRKGQDPVELILRGEPVPIRKREPGLPKGVAEVIDRALVVEVKTRYQTAGEMRKALGKVL